MSAELAFPDKFAAGIVAHINEDHRREMLELAHGLAGATWAAEAELAGIDKGGLNLLLRNGGREEPLRVAFAAPSDKTTDFRPAVAGLIQRARQHLAGDGQQ